ncbi:cell division protein ZapE [Pseudomonas sp. P66]|uniref:Cell division protein ZapE n=1 Tax=Pseudomonas arcuscaelestis TaxID=2710591 RepID=A0ABS2C0D5_9PSED|nr:cell division protein ZapE [Pseudomonas arcuscaelestis]MBM3113105.1 AFG1 family ATPase [Pseudomonas arcuscaelestis]MBM5459345.1 cell division protein ZapE [Pseudomonas arcuscaelestis]
MTCFTEQSPLQLYQQSIDRDGFVSDPAQLQAARALQSCFEVLQRGETPQGVYLWGPVGRGKTWLMDLFYQCLQVPARRQHFHHFMRWVHQRLFQLNGTADPLQALALSLAEEIRVLCFDELFVNDIGDAIILGRLFQVLFEAGVVVVATSNQPPDQLYLDGFNRERFVPAIAAIEQHMRVLAVAGEQDHRLHPGIAQQRYWVHEPGQSPALSEVFKLLSGGEADCDQPLAIGSRQLSVVRRSESVIWCRYADLCEQPFAAMDFMALCDSYKAILLGDVPALGARQRPAKIARGTEDGAERVPAGDRELPQLSVHDDGVRRFIALVDECYDRRVALYIEAEVALDALYTQGYLEFPFRRTLSRLREMQLQRFC